MKRTYITSETKEKMEDEFINRLSKRSIIIHPYQKQK
jgi:hypothetical protein